MATSIPATDPHAALAVLVVEDSAADARLVSECLRDTAPGEFRLQIAPSLGRARECLSQGGFDAILLDLGLPDSQGGKATLSELLSVAGKTPVLVLTGDSDHGHSRELIAAGAEDYLSKADLDGQLLARSLRYAIERARLRRRAETAEALVRAQRERRELEDMGVAENNSSVTARLYDAASLHESDPRLFQRLVEDYIALATRKASNQVYKANNGDGSQAIKQLAEQLGFVGAGPRDVIELHTEALRMIGESATASDERLIAIEGRLVVLELMGYLAGYYRRYYWTRALSS